jgi:peptidyl-prolyl cis-trans isomerase A (cyclophilin A)
MILSRKTTWGKQSLISALILLGGLFSCDRSRPERILMKTDLGEISLDIYTEEAPLTASNFLSLIERGIYSNACFYRVVRMDNQPGDQVRIEVVQGGLFDDSLAGIHLPIEHETTAKSGILHTDGVISMARNAPGSASTEFFICIGDQPSLDFGGKRNPDGEGFAAFGKVTGGMDVVRKIQSLPDTGQFLVERVRIHEMSITR